MIGAGAVGRSIALALFKGGASISGVFSRHTHSARALAKKVQAEEFGTLNSLTHLGSVVILCVPETEIRTIARIIAKKQQSLKGKLFVHTSGSRTSSELLPVKTKGATVGSFHPMQTFPQKKAAVFNNIWIALEGDRSAVNRSKQLAKILGANTFVISKEAKVQYHICGVFASNYLVTLMSVIEHISTNADIPKANVWRIFRPIIDQTIDNVVALSPKKALTGPIVRGDLETVQRHIRALSQKKLRHMLPLYTALGIATARLASRRKDIKK